MARFPRPQDTDLIPSEPPTPAEIARQTTRFAAALGKRNRERLRAAVQAMIKRHEQGVAARPPRAPLACKAGCSYCCEVYVSATAPEIFLLAEHVSRWPVETREALLERLRAASERTAGLDTNQRAALHLLCPLNVGGLCTAYEARPLGCRAYGSFDLAACERSHADPAGRIPVPVPKVAMGLRRFLTHCFRAALTEQGFDGKSYELIAGLRRVLETPDAEIRWLGGEDIFAGVQDDPRGAGKAQPAP